jgi:hypothetical protein
LFGNSLPNPKKDFFLDDILCTNHITFASKRALIMKIVDGIGYFNSSSKNQKDANKKKQDFDNLLRKVTDYRNAFAHGKLKHEVPTGCILDYYSGGHQEYKLNDEFWTKIENECSDLFTVLRDIINSILFINNQCENL